MVAEQIEQGHCQILARGDRAPPANGVETYGDAVFGHQIRIFAATNRQLFDMRIAFFNVLLVNCLFWGKSFFTDKIDAEVEQLFVFAFWQHIFDRGDQPFGLQITAAHAEGTGIKHRCIFGFFVSVVFGVGKSLAFFGAAIFLAFADRCTNFSHQREIDREWLVQTFKYGNALFAAQNPTDQIARKRAEHGHIDHANLDFAGFAQVIGHHFCAWDDAALPEQNIIRIINAISPDTVVAPAGQFVEFIECLISELLDVVEKVWPLRSHALHVRILVLHDTNHHWIVDIPNFRDATTRIAINNALRRCWRFDDIVGTAEELFDQFPLRLHH